jgi:Bacterial Ig-like domain (group 3)/FG-GAP-like repeat/Abnormal spindle-like microcephaly-assoc'd, ASPM-SPD-2-Hydin
MRLGRVVCLFAIPISTLVLAQSNRSPVVSQPNGLPITQQQQLSLPPNPYRMPPLTTTAQRRNGGIEATASQKTILPMPVLEFANAVGYGSGGYNARSVAVADVNGDGKPDVLVTNYCSDSNCDTASSVSVLLGNGDGTFQPARSYSSGGYYSFSVAVADVNGDGKPDLLISNYCSDSDCDTTASVGVLLGNGDGTFQTALVYSSGGYDAWSVAAADVNGDGKPDLLVAHQCGSANCSDPSGTVGVLLGNGDGTFQTGVIYAAGFQAFSLAVADVNGDGKPDVMVGNYCSDPTNCVNGAVTVLLGDGDGTFQAPLGFASGGYIARSVAVADVNGDGRPDVLVANYCSDFNNCGNGTVGLLLGNGDGTFQTAQAYSSGGQGSYSVAVADVNGDGESDVIVANNCSDRNCDGSIGVLLGNGDGTFLTSQAYGSGGYTALSVAVADVNGDGKPDLLVANECPSNNNCASGLADVLINVSVATTATAVTSSRNPSEYGQSVTFKATVTSDFFKLQPTGTVSFFDGTANIGNSQLDNGVATLTTSTLAVGTHSITATYNGDVNFLSSTSPVLHQVVQGAIVVLSPSQLDFGKQTVGIASSPKSVTLMNTGNVTLSIMSIGIAGANRGDFAQTNNCGTSIPANGSCTINVTFTPRATGTRNGAVSIEDNAPGSPQKVPLTGVGVSPAVTFSPAKLNFPTQVVFTTSASQPVTLTNTGSGMLLITNISVTAEFRQTNNCPASLDPQGSCTINVQFHPRDKGLQSGSIIVNDNAPGSPQKLPLAGTGTWVRLLPPELKFGSQPVGTKSLPRKITLTNKGDGAVNISAISITGVDASDFAETDNCGNQVPSGGSCFIKVTFKPLKKGKRTADVSVHDDGGGSPQKVGLTGTGT